MHLKLVETVAESMRVRQLRNGCREYLTNYTGHIGTLRQLLWYFRFYRHSRKTTQCRLYLWYDNDGVAVGYGAMAFEEGRLLVTECVSKTERGKGHGGAILDNLVRIATAEGKNVVADIWASNTRSIAMHEKRGFMLESSISRDGSELRTYVLSVNRFES